MAFPHYDYQYQTVAQKHLSDRTIAYSRGRGLGGSSMVNFCFYTRGPKDDYDEWARRVGDDFFAWKNAERLYKKLEGYQPVTTEMHKEYMDWKPENHGVDGPLKIQDPPQWESFQENALLAGYENGWKKNLDGNDGNPLGMSVCATTGYKSRRSTAKLAYLTNTPANLDIVTDAPATKILFDGKKAIGVHAGGKDYHAAKEVILSAGALDTPKLLMLSGVGPKAELEKHGISQLVDLPVGVGLQDHVHMPMILEQKAGTNERAAWSAEDAMAAAKKQFEVDGTGPLSIIYNSAVVGFDKGSASVFESQAFKDLPKDVQDYINKPTVPTYEFASVVPAYPLPGFDPTKTYHTCMVFGMVPQSRGTVTLKSSDPADPPVSDPNFLAHPFDQAVMIDAMRHVYKWLHNPKMTPDVVGVFHAPKSDSDEDLLEYVRNYGISTWHMACTAMMGKPDDETAVVTSDFKVKKLEGLRVADVSVVPFLPNAHTVAVAYMIGEAAAEKIIGEYGLES